MPEPDPFPPRIDSGVSVVVALVGGHWYVLRYPATEAGRRAANGACGRWAADPDLEFSWLDAAVMAQCVRQLAADSA